MKLEVRQVIAGYGTELILDGVELLIPEKKVVTLLGPNGCGKSTLLKVIGRLLKPRGGAVLLDGKSVHGMKTNELAREMAILPQIHQASSELTVEELIRFGRYPHRKTGFGLSARDREVVENVIALTRLAELRSRPLDTLSGGERQRAWIAMTLAQEPQVLLLDEPTTFLDICCQFEILELVRKMNHKFGITVLMVLHDLNLAARSSDILVTMKDRKIRHCGPPPDIIRPEILREIFDIEAEINLDREGFPYCIPTGSVRQKRS